MRYQTLADTLFTVVRLRSHEQRVQVSPADTGQLLPSVSVRRVQVVPSVAVRLVQVVPSVSGLDGAGIDGRARRIGRSVLDVDHDRM